MTFHAKQSCEKIKIYTDGACKNNGYPNAAAGYGVYFSCASTLMDATCDKTLSPISKRLKGKQTNQCAELYAVYAALKRLYWKCEPCHAHFYIDNENALNTLITRRKAGANWNIIEKMYKVQDILVSRGFVITAEWVKAHTNKSIGNTAADKLATAGAQKPVR